MKAGPVIRTSMSDLLRRPFSAIAGLQVLIALVSSTVPERVDAADLAASVFLLVSGVYLEIAATLAAAEPSPEPSADRWVRAAVAARCFWRWLGTSLLALVMVGVALVGLIVGGFVVGAIVGLAQPAAVLERRRPVEALARSTDVSRPARRAVGVVFGALVLAPTLAVQAAYVAGIPDDLGTWWVAVTLPLTPLTIVATIALTRTFVTLRGPDEVTR